MRNEAGKSLGAEIKVVVHGIGARNAARFFFVIRSPPRFDVVDEEGQPFWLFAAEEHLTMCDYSLHLVASRPAKVGDKLVTTKFNNSITRGFAAVGEPKVAVCLLPGTEIAFETEIECERAFRVLPKQTLAGTVARFRQIDMDKPNTHHDALELPNGQIVLLTRLCEDQHATVLQLPAVARIVSAAEPQKREAGVL
jgi:hypothetical protein